MKKIFKTPIFLAILIISGLIILNALGFLAVPKNILFNFSNHGQKISSQIAFKISNFFNFIKQLKNFEEQNKRLKEENQAYLGQITNLQEIAQENEFLRQQLGLPVLEEKQLVLAKVIGQEPTHLGRYLLIDQGQRNGLKENQTVVVSGHLLIGRVAETTSSAAKILLITDPNSLVNALIQDSRIKGMVKGQSAGGLMMDLILQEKTVKVGQAVVTSGLAGIYPGGLLIGEIEEVISSDPQIFQQAKIKPILDFEQLERVFVIID